MEKAGALLDVESLTVALEALTRCTMVHGNPQKYHMARARLMMRRREMLGLPEPVIAVQKAMTLDVEMGGVMAADCDAEAYDFRDDGPLHKTLSARGLYHVRFGGDGAVKLRARVHESDPTEPQSHEFRRLREATQVGVLRVPSGRVVFDGGGRKRLRLDIAPGDYTICAYGLGIGRKPECLMLLSPLTLMPDPLCDTPELQL